MDRQTDGWMDGYGQSKVSKVNPRKGKTRNGYEKSVGLTILTIYSDRLTDGWMNRRTDGWKDGRTELSKVNPMSSRSV